MSRVRRKKQSKEISAAGPSRAKKQKTIDLGWGGHDDDHVDSDVEEEEEIVDRRRASDDDDSVEEEETLDAKKVRLARRYLQKIEDGDSDESSDDESEEGGDDDDENYDRIGHKLQRERLKLSGSLETNVADKVEMNISKVCQSMANVSVSSVRDEAREWVSAGHVKQQRGHDLTPTCVALQGSGELAVSGSKDHSVIIWDVENEKRSFTLCPTWKREDDSTELSRTQGEVLAVACSDDNRYAAVGRRDSTVTIYDIRAGKNSLVHTFEGHKGAVTCLAFRTQSLQLFSGSEDRCIRHYNLNEMMYLETLYGHQFGVTDVDCHRKERPISVGRDRTARAWKLSEDTHLIFRGGAKIPSADCVSLIKDEWYLTGHDDGHLGLWMTEKKKAAVNLPAVHGIDGLVGRGITSLASLKGSDFAITGSYDGYLRLWKASTGSTHDSRGIQSLSAIPLEGYVNDIAVGPKARFCVAAVGQEPKLGRWNRISKAKNRFCIIPLRDTGLDDDSETPEDDEPAMEEDNTDDDESQSS